MNKYESKYPVMQSGFIGFTDLELVTPVVYNNLVIDNVLSKDYLKPYNKYFYAPEISQMYNLFISNTSIIRDFDFRERILKQAKQLFNNLSFYNWVMLQEKVKNLTSLHKAFLIETCEYLLTGERQIDVTQWINLIEKSFKSEGIVVDLGHFFNKSTQYNALDYKNKLPSLLTDILVNWTSKTDGFQDLLITLYVIFGNRPYITDVSENPRV